MKAEKITKIAVITAVGCVLGYIESLLPPVITLPGFKIGLANIAVMFALCKYGVREAFFVTLIKCIITALWFSAPSTFIYSVSGGIFALCAMWLARKIKMSAIGIGMCGGVFHNIGQLLAACVMLGNTSSLWLGAYLLPLGLLTGAAVGTVVKLLCKYTKNM